VLTKVCLISVAYQIRKVWFQLHWTTSTAAILYDFSGFPFLSTTCAFADIG